MSVAATGYVWSLADLSATDKLVALAYADHARPEGDEIRPAVATLVAMTGLSRRAVQLATRRLEDAGVLVPDGKTSRGIRSWRMPLRAGGANDVHPRGANDVRPQPRQGDSGGEPPGANVVHPQGRTTFAGGGERGAPLGANVVHGGANDVHGGGERGAPQGRTTFARSVSEPSDEPTSTPTSSSSKCVPETQPGRARTRGDDDDDSDERWCEQVLELYHRLTGRPVRAKDRVTATRLRAQGATLDEAELALRLAVERRRSDKRFGGSRRRGADPISSLAYIEPILEEVRDTSSELDPAYLGYLRARGAGEPLEANP